MNNNKEKLNIKITFVNRNKIREEFIYMKICIRSLTYNHHMSQSYASDVLMEPIFWFVDNFTHLLGPVSNFSASYNIF